MPKKRDLKVFVFYWSNPCLGIIDKKGTIHYQVHKKMVLAESKKEAQRILTESENKFKKLVLKSTTKSKSEVRKMANNLLAKEGFQVLEFSLRRGLII